MNKPKIAFLIPRLGISDRGAEIFVYELAKRLADDFNITVWTRKLNKKSPLKEGLKLIGVEVRHSESILAGNQFLQSLYSINFLKSTLDKYHLNPDEIEMLSFSLSCLPSLLSESYKVLFPVNGVWGAQVSRFVRAIKGTKFVYSSQGGIEPPIVRQDPNVYFAINPEAESWLKKHFPGLTVTLIPNGVDIKKFRPSSAPTKLKLQRPTYLCVAALIPAKRIDLSIRAVSELKRGSLLVVGEGPLRRELERLGKKLLGRERFLIKAVPYTNIPSYYTACEVFTLASAKEPFGIVYLEALASGLPVVTTDDKSRRYIVGQGGILCDTKNISKYASALNRVVQANFGSKPRNQAKKFSWDIVSKKYKIELLKLIK